jgi:hypothetical protein
VLVVRAVQLQLPAEHSPRGGARGGSPGVLLCLLPCAPADVKSAAAKPHGGSGQPNVAEGLTAAGNVGVGNMALAAESAVEGLSAAVLVAEVTDT